MSKQTPEEIAEENSRTPGLVPALVCGGAIAIFLCLFTAALIMWAGEYNLKEFLQILLKGW